MYKKIMWQAEYIPYNHHLIDFLYIGLIASLNIIRYCIDISCRVSFIFLENIEFFKTIKALRPPPSFIILHHVFYHQTIQFSAKMYDIIGLQKLFAIINGLIETLF